MVYKKVFECPTENVTCLLAQKIAKVAQRGDIFALYGTLGAGKSTFSRCFIQCLCQVSDVPSPTFTLVQIYEAPDFDIYHYDMYRLKSYEEAYELGVEESFYNAVNLIEWPEKIGFLLPKDIWKITITTTGETRFFEIEVSNKEKADRLNEVSLG